MKIVLLPPHPRYSEALLKWRNEANTLKFNPVKSTTLEELRFKLSEGPHELSPLKENVCYRWFIEADQELVGTVSLANVNLMMGLGEIGYMVGEEYQGKGIASQAVSLWTKTLFEQTNLRKLTASVADLNVASLRLLEKIGYRQEGFLVDHYLINGKPVSQAVFGVLRSEW